MNLLVIIPGFGVNTETPEKLRILENNLKLLHAQFDPQVCENNDKVVKRSKFSMWVFVYDDTPMPSFVSNDACVTVVRKPGVLGQYLIDYCHPDFIKWHGFTHVMAVLDDVEWITLDFFDTLRIYNHHRNIDILQPSLQSDTISLPYMKLQYSDSLYCGRTLDVVEWFSFFMDVARYKLWHCVLSSQNPSMLGVPRVLYNLYGLNTVVIDKYKMKHWYAGNVQDAVKFRKSESFYQYLNHHVHHSKMNVNLLENIGNIIHFIPVLKDEDLNSTGEINSLLDKQKSLVQETTRYSYDSERNDAACSFVATPFSLSKHSSQSNVKNMMINKMTTKLLLSQLIAKRRTAKVEGGMNSVADCIYSTSKCCGDTKIVPLLDIKDSVLQIGSFDGVDACILNDILLDPVRHLVIETNPETISDLERLKEITDSKFSIVRATLNIPSSLRCVVYDLLIFSDRNKQNATSSSSSAPIQHDPNMIEKDRLIFGQLFGDDTKVISNDIENQSKDDEHPWLAIFKNYQLKQYNALVMENEVALSFLCATLESILDSVSLIKACDAQNQSRMKLMYEEIYQWLDQIVEKIIIVNPLCSNVADKMVLNTPYVHQYLVNFLDKLGFVLTDQRYYKIFTRLP
jgi:hypothetical protein